MESMFYRCSNLQKLDLRSFDINNVENMGAMIGICHMLKIQIACLLDVVLVQQHLNKIIKKETLIV